MRKIKLSEIENFIDEQWYITKNQKSVLEKLIKAVRAAKLLFDLCEYDYGMDKTELTMLREALSQFDFGSDDE